MRLVRFVGVVCGTMKMAESPKIGRPQNCQKGHRSQHRPIRKATEAKLVVQREHE